MFAGSLIFTAALIAVGAILVAYVRAVAPEPFAFPERCQGRAWRRAFPATSNTAIREFLAIFGSAFEFPEIERLKFGPDQGILGVYRQIYPSNWTPDAMELETLALRIEQTYGFKLISVWSETLTLGQLFSSIHTIEAGSDV